MFVVLVKFYIIPVDRSPGETPRKEPSDELPTGSRQASLSQMQTRGRAARMEPEKQSVRQPSVGEPQISCQVTGSDSDRLALLITQALSDATSRQTEALAKFSIRQTQLMNSIELGFQRLLTQTPVPTGSVPANVTPSSQHS